MIMIPITFLIAIFAALILLREIFTPTTSDKNWWLIAFLSNLIILEVLIGIRFGYGFEELKYPQPVIASFLPPLAYLSFRNPKAFSNGLRHLIAPAISLLSIIFFIDALDAILAICNIFYAIFLLKLTDGRSAYLDWVSVNRLPLIRGLLWLSIAILLISGITDTVIAYDFWRNAGKNTSLIVGSASMIGILLGIMLFLTFFSKSQKAFRSSLDDLETDRLNFKNLNDLMQSERLYLDPDINLSRIARKMRLPSRAVSKAVNSQTNSNISQYINNLRIDEACRLLCVDDMIITQIVFAVGFNTKSNFNREFMRIKHQSPSEWRSKNSKSDL